MYKIRDKGKFETLPEMALYIYEGDVAAIETRLADGWDLEEKIKLGTRIKLSPLDLALIMDRLEIVKLLVRHGAELNEPGNPAFLLAVRYGREETVRFVREQGARIDLVNHVGSGAYQEAYYGKSGHIPLIRELGLDLREHGGETLRTAVSDHKLNIVEYLLDHGVDINYNEPDMVYPYRATPLTVAARNGNMAMVRYLVERGADVTLAEKNGERPYTIAVAAKNRDMAEFFKALEPPEFHDRSIKLHTLKSYHLPAELVAFLSGDELRLALPDNEYDVNYIDFFSLTDTIEMKHGRKKLLRLSAELDNYSDILLVWHPGSKMIGYYDVEHQEYAPLAKYGEFMANPGLYVERIFE
ncbi:ankyrin repeat domain-containing protein [Paenibacillus sp. alder61]|uniref:Uncharacterized protein n=1 Tax=Paenibacillus faecis TaxID=862114 RepID=A0A5D0CMH3_9BACL|nr:MULTISPECIES: ankyrin repeat domain-containing protein [Paenibacillus]MCA1292676.1 ankyrin repeat domain-containing protein [Paenibacillus sp. alder61]TYA11061.1 hypothetical protein FRY98_21945 [Paenibacillus faecis]